MFDGMRAADSAQVRSVMAPGAPYTFYLEGKIRHCGVDAIELLLDASGWQITQLSDTQRREVVGRCRPGRDRVTAASPLRGACGHWKTSSDWTARVDC
jgi:hypothetical protein